MEAFEASAAPSRLGMRGTVLVGATLFSMFFGAGNLILPPLLGVQAASSTVPAMVGFFVTGVGLPVLGIVAVALAGTVRELADRVHPLFSRVFVAAVYLAIGPCLAIPRTSSTAFEMLVPLLPEGVSVEVVRLAFSIAFFAVAYALAMRPGRLTRLLGRITGPALIALIVAVVGSSIARATDSGAYIHVGPEIGVASTKAFTGQVTVMAMLALAVGRERGTVTEAYYNEVSAALLHLPETMEEVLKVAPQVADLAKIFTYAHNFIYLGRGYNYPTALEGALKLKEISYIHAEGYPAAEMKHGPIALIDAEMPTVAIATPDHTYEKTASNIEEIKARGGKIIAVIARGDEQVRRSADFVIEVPVIAECLMPIVVSVPLQLLAYYIAVYKGRNVDQPRNLAKSVTVE